MSGYELLINYYKKCFSLVDCFHFNSEVSKSVYSSHLSVDNGTVIPITHSGIMDNRRVKSFDNNVLRLGFIGSEEAFKGLPLLIDVLGKIGMEDKWELSVWGGRISKDSSLPIYYKGKFNAESIEQVYYDMDVLIVPSVWKETFSLVTLEALSYGVPVIVSDNVGAKDVVSKYNPLFVFSDKENLSTLLLSIIENKTILKEYNNAICNNTWNNDMICHTEAIEKLIYKI